MKTCQVLNVPLSMYVEQIRHWMSHFKVRLLAFNQRRVSMFASGEAVLRPPVYKILIWKKTTKRCNKKSKCFFLNWRIKNMSKLVQNVSKLTTTLTWPSFRVDFCSPLSSTCSFVNFYISSSSVLKSRPFECLFSSNNIVGYLWRAQHATFSVQLNARNGRVCFSLT